MFSPTQGRRLVGDIIMNPSVGIVGDFFDDMNHIHGSRSRRRY
jgi:hypothetical protein